MDTISEAPSRGFCALARGITNRVKRGPRAEGRDGGRVPEATTTEGNRGPRP